MSAGDFCNLISSDPNKCFAVHVMAHSQAASSTHCLLFAGLIVLLLSSPAAAQTPLLWLDEFGHDSWAARPAVRAENEVNRLEQMIEAQLAGPDSSERDRGLVSFIPAGTRLQAIEMAGNQATITFEFPDDFLERNFDDVWLDRFGRWIGELVEALPETSTLSVKARGRSDGSARPMSDFLRIPPLLAKPEFQTPPATTAAMVPAHGQGQPEGALSGASIFLSPGHGWIYSIALDRWTTQRGNTHGLVEDFSNAEAVLQYLHQYLWNAGARVYTVRERDLNNQMVIVDQASTGYSETGDWLEIDPISGAYGEAHRQTTSATGPATATARFTPDIPAAGHYAVYAWYRPAPSGATSASVPVTIRHSGGHTEWMINQNQDGFTWKYLGTYYFQGGSNPESGSVTITNATGEDGDWVIADAIRFGGGMGDLPDDVSGTISGYPRWEESGRYFAGFMGKSDWSTSNTVSAMPRYAAWEHESWEDGKSVYVSWHTNAPDPGRGTSSFAYSSGGLNAPFDGVAGGLELRNAIHAQLINDIRAAWDPDWADRGLYTNWFGELNPGHNPEMPASLHEIAFHDTLADAVSLKHPRFRQLAARAMYQGIVDFYHDHLAGFENPVHLPEPPEALSVRAIDHDRIRVSWQPGPSDTGDGVFGAPAENYRVYLSSDGKGFANGIEVGNVTSITLPVPSGEPVHVRLTAVNAGGESFPTRTLGATTAAEGLPAVLIVDGFDRIDSSANLYQVLPNLGTVERGLLGRMNTFSYLIPHGQAIHATGRAFDSAHHDVLIAGDIDLRSYHSVIWILGEESTADSTFDATEQSLVEQYLDNGGRLFVSGSEIGWDLVAQGNGPDFFNQQLRASYVSDDAFTYTAQGSASGIFSDIGQFTFDDGSQIYDVGFPDRFAAANGSVLAMDYIGGDSGGAAIQFDGGTPDRRVVMLGFPFETIVDSEVRAQIMAEVLEFFETPANSPAIVFADRFE